MATDSTDDTTPVSTPKPAREYNDYKAPLSWEELTRHNPFSSDEEIEEFIADYRAARRRGYE